MPLYLVRHGEAYSEAADPDRSLTETGKTTVDGMAQLTAAFKIPVSQILHSGKTRARQTAELFSKHLKPSSGVNEIKGINPNDDVTKTASQLDSTLNAMIVGHLPFLERLVSYLVTGSPDRSIVKLQTGGIVCLDRIGQNGSWHIKWALMPKMV
ncbi:MAG: phosphohistidine phosphatase SixA [Deltaproteobacteria bacterium]|nr:phosphohistidine phosphatase SixA [Deltaproteobacteria bacterium]